MIEALVWLAPAGIVAALAWGVVSEIRAWR